MENGLVRSILWEHAVRAGAPLDPQGRDPNALLPAEALCDAVARLPAARQQRLAEDYVALWARTFRVLVGQLRGRPERTLALFADEVYPYLRGDRLAARVESRRGGEARLLMADDLPGPYLCGLVAAFVALSGARATCVVAGSGAYVVSYRIAAVDRGARLLQYLTAFRVPLILAAALAGLTGIGLAMGAASVDALRACAVVVGVVAAQAGANALHELRSGSAGPTAPLTFTRKTWWIVAAAGYSMALGAGIYLAVATPIILAFAAAGGALGLAYEKLRSIGPLLAGAIYGPLIGLGALNAFPVHANLGEQALLATATLPLGFMVAALLLLDDLADRPLDEAGGRRTLAVKLPASSGAALYATFLAASVLSLAAFGMLGFWPQLVLLALVLSVPAAFLGRRIFRDLEDPRRLATARLATFAILVTVATAMVATLFVSGVAG